MIKIRTQTIIVVIAIIVIIFILPVITAKEIKKEMQKEIQFLYPESGVYSPNDGTYQPYKTGKAHFLIPKITTLNNTLIKSYQLFDNNFLIGKYEQNDTIPNTAIITREGLHIFSVIGYDLKNKSIANDSVLIYAAFRYEDLYRILNKSTPFTIQDTVDKKEFSGLNASFKNYKTALKYVTINKTITDITAVDRFTNETVHHELIIISLTVDKQIDTLLIYEVFPKISFNNFQNLLFTDSFNFNVNNDVNNKNNINNNVNNQIIFDPIVLWKKENLQLLNSAQNKQIVVSYIIKQKLDINDIDVISTIPIVNIDDSSYLSYFLIIIFFVLAICGYFGYAYYTNYYKNKKNN